MDRQGNSNHETRKWNCRYNINTTSMDRFPVYSPIPIPEVLGTSAQRLQGAQTWKVESLSVPLLPGTWASPLAQCRERTGRDSAHGLWSGRWPPLPTEDQAPKTVLSESLLSLSQGDTPGLSVKGIKYKTTI